MSTLGRTSTEDFDGMLVEIVGGLFDQFSQEDIEGIDPTLYLSGFEFSTGQAVTANAMISLIGFDGDKHSVMFDLGAKLAKEKVFAPEVLFMVSEAWFTTFEKDSTSGTRTEGLFVAGLTSDGRANMCSITIKRDEGSTHFSGSLRKPFEKSPGRIHPGDPNYVMASTSDNTGDVSSISSPLLEEFFKGASSVVFANDSSVSPS